MFTGANGRDSIVDNLDDNCDIKVTGYDHHFAGEEKGKDSVVKNVRENIFSMLNENTIKFEVVHVIGGGDSPWAAVECKGTGKSKTGML